MRLRLPSTSFHVPTIPEHRPAETRSVIERTLAAVVLFGVVLRLRILFSTPLPSEQPTLWLLAGLVQDLAVVALLAALCLFLAWRFSLDRFARAAFVASVLVFGILALVRSETVIAFGSDIHAEEIEGMALPTELHGAGASGFVLLAFALVVMVAAFWLELRFSKRLRRVWLTASRGLFIAVVTMAAIPLFRHVHQVETSGNPVTLYVRRFVEPRARPNGGRRVIPRPTIPPIAIRELAPARNARKWLEPGYPLAWRPNRRPATAPRVPEGVRPNIVLLVLESFRAEEIGAYDGNPRSVTPNFDRIAKQGIRVDPVYAAGSYTASGEVALWYGLPPLPEEILMVSRPDAPLTGLPELLRDHGWRSFLWIHGGDINVYRRDLFYLPRGFQMVDGRDFPQDEPRTHWGFSDKSLVRRAIGALDRAEEPFASMVLTVSSHHPFDVPKDAESKPLRLPAPRRGYFRFPGSDQIFGVHTVPLIDAYHYTDEALGDFFRMAREKPWFDRTIFVLVADHSVPILPFDRKIESLHALDELRQKIPLVFYSPLLPGGTSVSGPASQVDVLPTLLGLLGIVAPRAGFGRDLLDPATRSTDNQVVHWSARDGVLSFISPTRAYHAMFRSDRPLNGQVPKEILIDTAADPEGRENLAEKVAPEELEAYRRLSQDYIEVYPWLVASGHAGVPPVAPPVAANDEASEDGNEGVPLQ